MLFATVLALPLVATADDWPASLKAFKRHVGVVSGGFGNGNRVVIRIGAHTFFDEQRPARQLAGLYVVAVHDGVVQHEFQYNILDLPGASIGFAQDIADLRPGTFVVVAVKDEATRHFGKQAQAALRSLGARKGLFKKPYRTSYLCIGMKGLAPGEALERLGQRELIFKQRAARQALRLEWPAAPVVQKSPGMHTGLKVGHTEVIYYIPQSFDPGSAQYLVGIHGAGDWHRPGALNRIAQFRQLAERENLVILAPSFDALFNRALDRRRDLNDQGRLRDQTLVKHRHLTYFQVLLNQFNEYRSDLKLIEIFEFFNNHLMRRENFHLYGHSGGGQFVNRFSTFHPELINKVAFSAAGTFTFPDRTRDYPWGLSFDHLEQRFGQQIDVRGIRLSARQLDEKINALLDLELHIIVGENDTLPDGARRVAEIGWQGVNHVQKARNYLAAMKREHTRQIQAGHRPADDPFRFQLHILPGIAHDSASGARKAVEVLFPSLDSDN